MKSLKQFFSKGLTRGFSLFSHSKKRKIRKHKTRRHRKRQSRRNFMRGG